jgi:hypothetical protein
MSISQQSAASCATHNRAPVLLALFLSNVADFHDLPELLRRQCREALRFQVRHVKLYKRGYISFGIPNLKRVRSAWTFACRVVSFRSASMS